MTPDDVRLALGKGVQATLSERGVTQAAAAKILDVRPATISDWCRGRSSPSAYHVLHLEQALGVPPGTTYVSAGLVKPPLPEPMRLRLRIAEDPSEPGAALLEVSTT